MTTALSLDGRLLACCNVAAGIEGAGAFHYDQAWYNAAGFLERPVALVGGPDDINACLVGQILQADGLPATVICFRGTLAADDESRTPEARLLDWVTTDFDAPLVHWHGTPWAVHDGFSRALDSLLPQIAALVPDSQIALFAGHSKGGALAFLAAAEFYFRTGRPSLVTTFGAPRSGGRDYAIWFDTLPITSRRYENHFDLVPHVPFNDTSLAMLIGFVTGASIPRLDYHSTGELRFINPAGMVEIPTPGFGSAFRAARAGLEILDLVAMRRFSEIRDAHGINFNHGYSNAVAPEIKPEILPEAAA